MTRYKTIAAAAAALLLCLTSQSPAYEKLDAATLYEKPPRLVLVVIFDQFRADYVSRFWRQFAPPGTANNPGGFRFLSRFGAHVPLVEHNVAQAMTAIGHSTVVTGAYPHRSGIVLNEWYDATHQRMLKCEEDPRYSLLGFAGADKETGASPWRLVGTTISDEAKNAGHLNKVVSISLKGRSAVLMGGYRADEAIWFDKKHSQWTSSSFYFSSKQLPQWVVALNKTLTAQRRQPATWTAPNTPQRADDPGRAPQNDHPNNVLKTPYGNDLVFNAAQAALATKQLGKSPDPDWLFVSFSSPDYVGHTYGPNSRQVESITLHNDATLSRLLKLIQKTVVGGLGETLVVVTGDHGIVPRASYLREHRVPAGTVDLTALQRQLEDQLNQRFGRLPDTDATLETQSGAKKTQWIPYFSDFQLYLNHHKIAAAGKSLADVHAFIKSALQKRTDIAHVITGTDVAAGRLPAGKVGAQLRNSYFFGRSGDVLLIPQPYVIPSHPEFNVDHITGYSYDRFVPLFMMGRHVKAGFYPRIRDIIDVAPTLALLTGVLPPAMAEGQILNDLLD